jgi:hypothetical protein
MVIIVMINFFEGMKEFISPGRMGWCKAVGFFYIFKWKYRSFIYGFGGVVFFLPLSFCFFQLEGMVPDRWLVLEVFHVRTLGALLCEDSKVWFWEQER